MSYDLSAQGLPTTSEANELLIVKASQSIKIAWRGTINEDGSTTLPNHSRAATNVCSRQMLTVVR